METIRKETIIVQKDVTIKVTCDAEGNKTLSKYGNLALSPEDVIQLTTETDSFEVYEAGTVIEGCSEELATILNTP